MSDTLEHIRVTQQEQSQPGQGAACAQLEPAKIGSCWPRKVPELDQPVPREHVQCSINKQAKEDFVDEGYFSPSPTESETEFFSAVNEFSSEPEVENPPRTPQIAINDKPLQLPRIRVTDPDGETEIIAPDDDEHGQFWNFARDKIARRMFFIRAHRRTQHMESTFYSDLYPVSKDFSHVTFLQGTNLM